jgi:hypothetical protein
MLLLTIARAVKIVLLAIARAVKISLLAIARAVIHHGGATARNRGKV